MQILSQFQNYICKDRKHLCSISNVVLICLSSFILFSFQNSKSIVSNFDSNKWKKDSLGCLGYRKENYNYLQSGVLKHKSKEEVTKFLGPPIFSKDDPYPDTFGYFLTCADCPNHDCDSQELLIEFNENEVVKVYAVVP